MRVLTLTNLYPNPLQPFRAPFNRHQLRLLTARHPVRVVAPIAWTDELRARANGKDLLGRNRRIVHDGITVDHPTYWYPPRVGRSLYGHFFLKSVKRSVRSAIEEFAPDLLFAPWVYPDGWAAMRLGRYFGLPVVVQVHGSDIHQLYRYPARRKLTADAVSQADGVVAVSRDLARKVIALGSDPDRVRVIHDGVDPALFCRGPQGDARERLGVPPDDPVITFIGNLVQVKAIDVLITAIALLKDVGVKARLFVIGAGPLREFLESLASRLGLSERVFFLGPLPQDQLPDWYRASDLFVLPSVNEGIPNVLLEASACGTPWVASRVGGIPEIVHLRRSRLVPPGDAAALAQAIRTSLESPPPVPLGPGHVPRRSPS